ncbi:glycosyltransferase [Bradyrhizobium zhanjiangense]|uniref:glycosyltransferase n=1 Tax=Bradyrhizobium zhanjiangense TaxID=1325107 RepID=UPI0013E8CB30|nr:glycosyltransferase [Bradyrhizobium zhanjiangense]
MTSRPLVSVIIPAHNAAKFIEEAIDSALHQSYSTVEVVVVDDGSTDATRDVLRSYGNAITSVFQPNAGQSAAINRGFCQTTGDLIAYLGADDRLHTSAIEILVNTMVRDELACLVYPDFHLIDERGAVIRRVLAPPYEQRRLIADFRCLPGPGALVRKRAWSRCGGWSNSFRQIPDMDFYFRLSLLGPFARVPHYLADFRVHPGSTTKKASSHEMANEPMKLINEFFNRSDLPASVRMCERQSRASALALAGFLHATGNRKTLSAQCFAQAIRLNPRTLLSRQFASYATRSLVRLLVCSSGIDRKSMRGLL